MLDCSSEMCANESETLDFEFMRFVYSFFRVLIL